MALPRLINTPSLSDHGVFSSNLLGERLDRMGVRALDVVGSLILLVVVAPLLVFVSLLIYVSNPGPVFFSHARIGRGGQIFRCFKFRSMVTDAQARLNELLLCDPEAAAEWERDHKLKKDPRITPIGAFLRKSSLDELPQLLNVLRGEMSLVGPRPIVRAEIAKYGRYFRDYCEVRPGITGLWQISGRNDIPYRRRVALDVAYIKSYSLALNIWILLMTVPSVLKLRGSY